MAGLAAAAYIMMRFIIPLLAVVMISVLLYQGFNPKPREFPSPLIGKMAPAFSLPLLREPDKKFSPRDMLGKVWLLNLWASWCVACKEENTLLLALARQNVAPIYGVDYKDKREDGEAWLARGGNPYVLSVMDPDDSIGNDYGIFGVPETYVIDKQGIIRYKQAGVITPQLMKEKILPLIAELQNKK